MNGEDEGKVEKLQRLDFAVEREGFSVYSLSDGARLRVKHVLAEVVRKEGAKAKEGYGLNFQAVVVVEDNGG